MNNFKRYCTICKVDFSTKFESKRVCSFECRQQATRENSRKYNRVKRNKQINGNLYKCFVCGWHLTIDNHHENGTTFHLCPNHHSLITRNVFNDVNSIISSGSECDPGATLNRQSTNIIN